MFKTAQAINQTGVNTYVTLNLVKVGVDTCVKDSDIVKREFIFFDIDPVRPKGVSATEQEKTQGLEKVLEIKSFLSKYHFPEPITADSGNGYYLLYPTELTNSVKNNKLVKKLTHAVSNKFSDEHVEIDKKVHNPSRIIKIMGTMACKGPNSKERPHRLSNIVSCPDGPEKLAAEQIKVVVEQILDKKKYLKDCQGKSKRKKRLSGVRRRRIKSQKELKWLKKDIRLLFYDFQEYQILRARFNHLLNTKKQLLTIVQNEKNLFKRVFIIENIEWIDNALSCLESKIARLKKSGEWNLHNKSAHYCMNALGINEKTYRFYRDRFIRFGTHLMPGDHEYGDSFIAKKEAVLGTLKHGSDAVDSSVKSVQSKSPVEKGNQNVIEKKTVLAPNRVISKPSTGDCTYFESSGPKVAASRETHFYKEPEFDPEYEAELRAIRSDALRLDDSPPSYYNAPTLLKNSVSRICAWEERILKHNRKLNRNVCFNLAIACQGALEQRVTSFQTSGFDIEISLTTRDVLSIGTSFSNNEFQVESLNASMIKTNVSDSPTYSLYKSNNCKAVRTAHGNLALASHKATTILSYSLLNEKGRVSINKLKTILSELDNLE